MTCDTEISYAKTKIIINTYEDALIKMEQKIIKLKNKHTFVTTYKV